MRPLLGRVAKLLGYQIFTRTIPEAWKTFNEYVNEAYEEWKNLVKKAIDCGINIALNALNAAKEVIVEKCKKNEKLMRHLSKIAIKATTRVAMEIGAKSVTRFAAKKITKQVASQGVKGLAKSAIHPVGIGADVAQAVLEYNGYEDAGKTVGAGGNMLAGVLIGGTVAGPPGAAVGALGGFVIWLGGEITGGLVERAFGDKGHTD